MTFIFPGADHEEVTSPKQRMRDELAPLRRVVELAPVGVQETVTRTAQWGRDEEVEQFRMANKYQAIRDVETGKVLSIMSDRYHLIQNREIIDEVLDVVWDEGMPTPILHNYFTGYEGRSFQVEFQYPEELFTPRDGQGIIPRLIMGGSYDGTKRVWFELGAFRLVCSNGMMVGTIADSFNQRHMGEDATQKLMNNIRDRLQPAIMSMTNTISREISKISDGQFDTSNELVTDIRGVPFLSDEKMRERRVRAVYKKLPVRMVRNVAERMTSSDTETPWDLYNLVTNVVSHETHGRLTAAARIAAQREAHKQTLSLLRAA